jgi:excisionase family DNA binding protein
MNSRQAWAYLGVEERFLRRLVAERRIAYYKFGPGKRSPLIFDKADLDTYLDEHRIESQSS